MVTRLMTDTTCPAQRANLKIAAADLTRDGLPDLSGPAAQRLYSKVVEDADLVIVDNISALCRMMKENDADTWTPVQNWALQLRRAGKSVILIHHAGKSGRQRGTSRKEDVLDTIIGLRRPPDYSPDRAPASRCTTRNRADFMARMPSPSRRG